MKPSSKATRMKAAITGFKPKGRQDNPMLSTRSVPKKYDDALKATRDPQGFDKLW